MTDDQFRLLLAATLAAPVIATTLERSGGFGPKAAEPVADTLEKMLLTADAFIADAHYRSTLEEKADRAAKKAN